MNAYSVFRDDLLAYAQFVQPGYEISKHHKKIAKALQAAERGEIKRLIISCPPQRGKTALASILFPSWAYGRNPNRRIILSGYTAEVAERYSRGARDSVNTDRYRAVFNHALDPSVQNIAFWRFKDSPGYVRAVGVGGAATSFGADFFIIDDPIKDQAEAMSETIRQTVWDWYQSVVLTRLSPGATVAVIQTRWHLDDLVGRLLADQPDNWTVVNIPAVSDEGVVWPERWTREDYDRIKAEVGSRVWNALYQGQPVDDEGGLFKRAWLGNSPTAPQDLRWIRAWDLATSEKTSADYTVGALMAVDATKTLWIKDVVRGQWEWPEARRRIIQTANTDGPEVSVYVEQGAFKGGALCQDLLDSWERIEIPLYARKPVGDKVQRANPVAARAESGRVRLVEGPWNKDFVDEFASFPLGKHDDQVDAVSLGFSSLASEGMGRLSEMLPPRPGTYAYFKALAGEDIYDEDEDTEEMDPRATFSGISAG